MSKTATISIANETGIVGHNEDGPVHGTVYFLLAEFPNGKRYRHTSTYQDPDKIQSLLAVAEKSYDDDMQLDHSDMWGYAAPRYGSEYHQQIGDEHLMDEDERDAQAHYGLNY